MAERTRQANGIGRRIAEMRKSRGVALTELARHAHLSRQSLSYIEREVKTPRVRTLLPILAALGCSVVSDVTVPGRRIRTLRQIYLLTMTEIGKLAGGANRDQVFEWETGKIVPSLPVLARLADRFGVGLSFFSRNAMTVS